MTFDALTLAAVRDELEAEVRGGQVQGVVLAGPLTVGLEIYAQGRRRFLLCSAEPLAARVCLSADRPVRDADTPTPLLLLLRKHVRDGRLVGIEQPPYERLLKLRIAKRDDTGVRGEVALIIEAMGRRSNVVLVGADGCILDALRRVGPTRNPRRAVLPRRPYLDPPPQDRLDPLDAATYGRLRSASFDQPSATTEDLLAARLAGFSPLAAREAAFRANDRLGRSGAEADWGAVEAAVRDLLGPLESGRWQPTVCRQDERVVAFAPYRLTQLPESRLEAFASISRVVELGLAETTAPRPAPPANRALIEVIDGLRGQAERKAAALARALETADEAGSLQQDGEAVLANLALIRADQTTLDFNGRQIALDPELSPLENAQRLFRDYRKARDAARQVPRLLEATRLRLRQLDELGVLAEVADSPGRQRALREDLAPLDAPPEPASERPTRKGKARPSTPDGRVLRTRTPDGLEVLVGTSGRGNETVTFKLAQPGDLWLHARGVPGSHVILRTAGREPPPASLLYAARLAARNSRARAAGRVEVDYTPRKWVRKIPAAPPGLVTYSGERTLAVGLDEVRPTPSQG